MVSLKGGGCRRSSRSDGRRKGAGSSSEAVAIYTPISQVGHSTEEQDGRTTARRGAINEPGFGRGSNPAQLECSGGARWMCKCKQFMTELHHGQVS